MTGPLPARGHVNLSAYEGVEAPANFAAGDALERYRALALEKTRAQSAFIASDSGTGLDVLEIGCGNGRLGVALREAGVANRYLGIDIAQSRIEFAHRWVCDLGLTATEFACADATRWQAPRQFDVVACITGAFGYFEAIEQGGAARVLALMSDACRPGGRVVIEIYAHTSLEQRCMSASEHSIREWSELQAGDPYEFYLHHFRFEPARRMLTHEKIFVPRDRSRAVDRRAEMLRLYRSDEMAGLFEAVGLRLESIAGDWARSTGNGNAFIAVGRR